MKNEKGITLTSLVITIVLLILIATISISSGVVTIKNAKFNKAKNEMELVQANVNNWNKEYNILKTDKEKEKYLEDIGDETSDAYICNQNVLDKTVKAMDIDNIEDYRFLSDTYLKNKLGLEDSYEFLVDIIDKKVILFNGIEYEGKTYYTPDDFDIATVRSVNPVTSVDFKLATGEEAEIIIYDLKFTDKDKEEADITNFDVQYKNKSDQNSEWVNVTNDLTKYIDEMDKTVKYKFLVPQGQSGEYNVKISAPENEAEKELSIKVDAEVNIASTTETSPFLPNGSTITNNKLNTGLTIKDNNQNEWVWIEVPKSITASKTTDAEIEQALQTYAIAGILNGNDAKTSRTGFNDVWHDKLGTEYDGVNEYSEIKYIKNDKNGMVRFNEARSYYGKIYTDTALSQEATVYVAGIPYYAKITDKKSDKSGCGLTYEDYNTKKSAMLQSIKNNGGFYIGKYEAGYEGDEYRTAPTQDNNSPTQSAVIKQNAYPYNYVTCSEAEALAEGFSSGVGGKNTTLMFGIQWDLVLKHLNVRASLSKADLTEDSRSWGNYRDASFKLDRGNWAKYGSYGLWNQYNDVSKDDSKYVENGEKKAEVSEKDSGRVLLTTDAADKNTSLNICDFAGNVWEWTLEKSSDSKLCATTRGGGFDSTGSEHPASIRGKTEASSSLYSIGFRVTLY